MQLIPENPSIQQRSAMFHVSQKTPADHQAYCLLEKAYGHLIIRASRDNKSVQDALMKVTQLTLPTSLNSQQNDSFIINWIGPDEFLLLVPERTEFEAETRLRQVMQEHYAIVNVTGGQTVLEISGERVESILKKSTSYDIHLKYFPIGKVVTTVFAKSQLVLRRTAYDEFQLIIRRSFSDYLWNWIVDAGSRK